MKRALPIGEQVDIISSDESSSSEADDDGRVGKKSKNNVTIQPAKEIISEGAAMRKAQMYQEYMKEIKIPTRRGSVIPFTSWTGLADSMKQLYGQPLHYLTNIHINRLDQLRIGSEDEDKPLDIILHPCKAEASIWIMEEAHRLTTSHHYLAKLWIADPMYHAFIDPIFPKL